jgi:hypothetical protein
MGSPRLKIDSTDIKRWGWIALAACIASILDVIIIHVVPDLQQKGGSMTLIATSLILIVDFLRRYVTDTRVMKALIFAFILNGIAYAQLEIPQNVDEYTLVKASVPAQENSVVLWDVYSVSSGNPFVDTASFIDSGKNNLVFTGAPGKYAVKVRVIAIKDGVIQTVYQKGDYTNIAKGTAPAPNPTPTPNPPSPPNPGSNPNPTPKPVNPVNPEFPDAPLGYAKLAYANAVNMTDKVIVKAIANNFESIAASINAGGIKSVSIAFSQLTTSNSNTLNGVSSREEWRPWFTAIEAKLKADVSSGALSRVGSVADAFMEISMGLREVK